MKLRPIPRWSRHPAVAAWCGGLLLAFASAASAQEPPTAPAPPPPPASEPAAAEPPAPPAGKPAQEDKPDAVAARYLVSCSGCHTLTGVKLTGPGLATSMTWPDDQLRTAVKRMEDKVGPLKDEDVDALTAFIKDPDASARLAAEQEKMQARLLAKMDPPDAGLGKQLFTGAKGFKNGGLACAACHAVSGEGGNLGPDLTGLFGKMGGKAPLVSAIEKSNYKIMEPHYSRHPVTTQEALHLTEYFSVIDPSAPAASAPRFAQAGAGLAGLLLAATTLILRAARNQRGRETQLVRRRN